jgi:hypothetical protein
VIPPFNPPAIDPEKTLKVLRGRGFDQIVVRYDGAYERFEIELQRTKERVVGWDAESVDTDREVVEGVGMYCGQTFDEALTEAALAAVLISDPPAIEEGHAG